MPPRSESTMGAAALSKGLDLFRLILADRGRTPLAELVAPQGLPCATVHRLLGELQRQGLVTRVGRGRYDVGLVLAEASAAISHRDQMARAARRPLERLAERTGLTAYLGVFENDMVTYLVKTSSSPPTADFTRENGQLEAYCTGLGKILLAYLPDVARAAYLAGGPFVALTSRTLTDPAALERCLAEVAAQGYATDDGEIADQLRCLAVPVRRPDGTVAAAISVSALGRESSLADDDTLKHDLRQCALEIGSGFGW